MADEVKAQLTPPIPMNAERIAQRDPRLSQDLNTGLRFLHETMSATRRDVYETANTVFALLEEMRDRGLVDEASLDMRLGDLHASELERIEDHVKIRLEHRINKYELGSPGIPCDELIPLCRGRCCTLHFPLSKQDLGERVVKWDYLRPYIIRQRESDGYCVHNEPTTHGCTVYHVRPAVCRTYDCRNDKRIWVDFEKRIPTVSPEKTPREEPTPYGPPPSTPWSLVEDETPAAAKTETE